MTPPRPVFHQPVPAHGGHPGVDPVSMPMFQHDPRGYPQDWRTGWQAGYTDAWQHNPAPGGVPSGVLDNDHYWDGWHHGTQVGAWQRRAYRQGVLDGPSPFWTDPAETENTRPWMVEIGTVEVDAATAAGAARQARRLIIDGGFPRVVSVRLAEDHHSNALDIDLDARPDTRGNTR